MREVALRSIKAMTGQVASPRSWSLRAEWFGDKPVVPYFA